MYSFSCVLFAVLAATISACESAGKLSSEKGLFQMEWCFLSSEQPAKAQTADSVQITFSAAGNAYVGLGFGGSMYDADIVAGWIAKDNSVVIQDYYSSEEAEPKTDQSLGGTNDVEIVSGSRDKVFISNSTEPVIVTTLTFVRKLHTADQFDRDITLDQPNDMIYAYANADENGLVYHGDNHNHIFVDFTKADGIPDNQFGYEESGALSRDLVKNSFYGTLSTMQSEAAGAMNVANYPFGSVADFADEEPSTGRPLLLLSDLERNVINMKTNPKVSLSIDTLPSTVAEFKNPNLFDEMTHPRTTLLGTMELIPKDSPELQQAKDTYLAKHPLAKAWINFSDFNMYRMIVEDVYVVGGFGNDHYIGYISSEQYLSVSMQ